MRAQQERLAELAAQQVLREVQDLQTQIKVSTGRADRESVLVAFNTPELQQSSGCVPLRLNPHRLVLSTICSKGSCMRAPQGLYHLDCNQKKWVELLTAAIAAVKCNPGSTPCAHWYVQTAKKQAIPVLPQPRASLRLQTAPLAWVERYWLHTVEHVLLPVGAGKTLLQV